jgi:hypothetical protein
MEESDPNDLCCPPLPVIWLRLVRGIRVAWSLDREHACGYDACCRRWVRR